MNPQPQAQRADFLSSETGLPWFHRLSRPILFLIVTLALVGGYLAFSIPIAVFPSIDFPRIVIGVDNGVTPIDQMLVTITRPLEEAVNSVPGLTKVQSITSRGSAEIDLFFDRSSDMILTLQRVDLFPHRRLAQAQGAGRGQQAALPGRLAQAPQLLQRQLFVGPIPPGHAPGPRRVIDRI